MQPLLNGLHPSSFTSSFESFLAEQLEICIQVLARWLPQTPYLLTRRWVTSLFAYFKK
jgi:hypothetical protein